MSEPTFVNYIPVEYVFMPLVGLQLAYFLIGLSFKKRHSYDPNYHLMRDYQAIVKGFLYFSITLILLWEMAGVMSFVFALGVLLFTTAIDFWFRVFVPMFTEDARNFLERGGIHRLLYSLLFISVVCGALAVHNHRIITGAH